MAYYVYMTESMRLMAQGKYIDASYMELVEGPRPEESAEEIVDRVLSMSGLEVIG